ncbi:MAG: peptidoglycan binding domain-containing protein, partial [Oscillospiraceae bacterium]|nr:peptidoglycan binding domain-containing protein [Oscillospiraceae bacterium]
MSNDTTSARNKALIGVGAAAAVYLEAALLFSTHFAWRATLNGTNVAWKTPRQVEETLTQQTDDYILTVTGRNGVVDTIHAADIGLTRNFDGTVMELLHSRNPFLWPLMLGHPSAYTMEDDVTYSEDALREVVSELAFFNEENLVSPEYAGYEVIDGHFEAVTGDPGAIPDEEKTYTVIAAAISGLQPTVSLDFTGAYKDSELEVVDEALLERISLLNDFATATITIPFGDAQEVVDPSLIAQWALLEGDTVTLSEEAVTDYVNALA